ncbi:MAG TPA: molybdopterin cofactor-binding domain-containing protein [Rectinemataceae bacterium]|nr:molybdopterin cofactor-binding domain-containing protein [Rectinemataceae bacterium]
MGERSATRSDRGAEASALSDILMPGLVHVAHIRAPVAEGRLRRVVTRQLPRGYRLVTAEDIQGSKFLPGLDVEIPILASDVISWPGEPVALIAGPDPDIAEELARTATVELVAAEADDDGARVGKQNSAGRVLAKRILVAGDPDAAFSRTSVLIDDTWNSSILEHWYSEPQGALAHFDYDRIVIHTATQWPSHVLESVASVLGCKTADVRVKATRLGVHLDGKIWYPSMLAAHAALAAKACKAPARILLTREEDFRYSPKSAQASIWIKAGLDADNNPLVLDATLRFDMGSAGPFAADMLVEAGVSVLGAYRWPNVRIEAVALTSKGPPSGAFAGLGAAGVFFASGSMMSRLAETIEEDPVSFKTRCLLGRSDIYPSGETIRTSTPLPAIGERISRSSDFARKHASYELVRKRRTSRVDGPLRGIGYSQAFQADGMASSTVPLPRYALEAKLGKDLGLTIACHGSPSRIGSALTWKDEAARILGLPVDTVKILESDTDVTPPSGPGIRSRSVTVSGRLLARACTSIAKRRFRDPLPISVRSTARVERCLTWTEEGIEGQPFSQASWAGSVVEVELDPWTMVARPTGIWLCIDAGRIISPARATKAIRAAAMDALGASMGESVTLADGIVEEGSYFSYVLQSPRDIPPILVDFVDPDRDAAPRGIGELPFHCVPAAFISAASQAAGEPLSSLPAQVSYSAQRRPER